MRIFLAASAALLCSITGGCSKEAAAPPPPRPVETLIVAPAAGGTIATYPGQVVSRYQAELGFRVGGTITAKLVNVGDRVSAGQVLARIDPADAQVSLQGARAQTGAAASAVQQQITDLARARRLLAEGFVSQAEFDRQRVAVDQARAQLSTARSQETGASRQLAYTSLRAERAGVVTAFVGDVGQVVPAGQTVATVATPGATEVVVSIPEGDVNQFRSSTLRVRLWSARGPGYAGQLRTLAPEADPQTRTFEARVAFDPPAGVPLLGTTAEITATSPVASPLLRVPVTALTRVGDRSVVWIVKGSPARVSPRAIRISEVQQNAVLVAGGIAPGERVVTAGVHLLHAGDMVRPIASSASTPR